MRQFWAWSHAEDEIPTNPMLLVKPPTVPEKAANMLLTLDQLRQVIEGCGGPKVQRVQALILPYADTGARLSEIARAEVADLDLRQMLSRYAATPRAERAREAHRRLSPMDRLDRPE